MRIVFVNSARGWGGGLTSAAEVGIGLASRGHDVTLACHPHSAIYQQLRDEARLTLAPIALRAELNPYRVYQLARLNRSAKPDIVLADKRKDVKLSAAARWLGGKFPLVHRHGAPSPLKDSYIYRHFWGREVQTLIVNSRAMRKRMLATAPWLDRTRIHVIHNGKNTDRYRPLPHRREQMRTELGIPADAFVISFHGMVQPRKKVELLVKAVSELPRELCVYALIVGGGPTLAELRRLATGLRAPTIFTGIRDDIPEVLSAADAAAHLSTAEGFSNSVIEAMACGLPLILSDATSHAEQVEDGQQGVLVPANQWEGIADAVRWLATDREGRDRMARAARRRATSEFSHERMIERYDAVLRQTVEMFAARRQSGAGPTP